MTTTLEMIDKEVNALVDDVGQSIPATVIQKRCTVYIGGFPVVHPDRVEAVTKDTANKQSTYVADRAALKEKLAACGVKAKAFLPRRVWIQVCDQSGLFRLAPNANNTVSLRVNSQSIINRATVWSILTIAVIELTVIGWFGQYQPTWGLLGLYLVGMLTVTTLATVFACVVIFGGLGDVVGQLQLWLYSKFATRRQLLMHFMPQMHTMPDLEEGDKRMEATLILPTPPEHVVVTLSKMIRFGSSSVCVAAVPEAIHFGTSFYNILNRDHEARVEERRIADASRDPIVYIINGEAVAIIEQFGDFPIEIETVRNVLNLEYLI